MHKSKINGLVFGGRKCLHAMSQKRALSHAILLAVNYLLFSNGDVSYRFNGKNDNVVLEYSVIFTSHAILTLCHVTLTETNEKRDNKQCLLDTPRRVTVTNNRLISKHKKSEKNLHIYKSHGIIKNYKRTLF